MNPPNVEQLELRALEEREQIHHSVEELKSQVTHVRHILNPVHNARKYFLAASIAASAAGFLSGYGFASILPTEWID
jgi:hypothetical protein